MQLEDQDKPWARPLLGGAGVVSHRDLRHRCRPRSYTPTAWRSEHTPPGPALLLPRISSQPHPLLGVGFRKILPIPYRSAFPRILGTQNSTLPLLWPCAGVPTSWLEVRMVSSPRPISSPPNPVGLINDFPPPASAPSLGAQNCPGLRPSEKRGRAYGRPAPCPSILAHQGVRTGPLTSRSSSRGVIPEPPFWSSPSLGSE